MHIYKLIIGCVLLQVKVNTRILHETHSTQLKLLL